MRVCSQLEIAEPGEHYGSREISEMLPMKGGRGMAESIAVWLSDGSGAPFVDVHALDATHPGFMGQPVAWQGWVDSGVPVGEAQLIVGADDRFVPEAEWCVSLLDPDLDSARIDGSTAVVLQGLIEGKWLNRLRDTLAWQPASVGNNLYATGRGIRTTLAAVEAGEQGEVVVRYWYGEEEQERRQRALLAALVGHNIPGLVRAVLQHGRSAGMVVQAIDCAAIGREAAVVNESDRVQGALQASGLRPADLTTPTAWQRVGNALIDSIIEDGLAARPGRAITLQVFDQMGQECGHGELLLLSPSS